MQDSGRKQNIAVQSLLDKFRNAGLSDGPNPPSCSAPARGLFRFPPPPILAEPRRSPACNSDASDGQNGACALEKTQRRATAGVTARTESESDKLPPIGVFWDIENCQVPHGKSALTIVQAVRNTFFEDYREAEFTVVCDVHKESPTIVQELNDAQVDLLHVISSSKNAADEKLRQAIRRFADTHGSPSAVILISSDVNFAPDLSDLRHRKKIHVILLHGNCSDSLMMCANEHYNFSDFTQPLPNRNQQMESQSADIFIWNLPMTEGDQKIRWRLKTLSQNCGGRIIVISRPMAVLRFPTLEMAVRAQKRMDGELVFGQAIRVGISHFMDPPVNMDSCKFVNRSRSGTSAFQFQCSNSQSNFLPVNPNPWAFYNGNDQNSSSLANNRLPESLVQKTATGGASYQLNGSFSFNEPLSNSSSSAFNSPWNSSHKDTSVRNGATNGIAANRFMDFVGANGATLQQSVPAGKKMSQVKNGSSAPHKGWNATPTFTTANLDPRDWSDNSKRHRRRSPSVDRSQQSQPSACRSLEPGWAASKTSGPRQCRTPSPYMFNQKMAHPLALKPEQNSTSNRQSNGREKDKYFSPICPVGNGAAGVELRITSLDQHIEPKEMKKILFEMISEHVKVLNVSVFVQSNQTIAASVSVPTPEDARLVVCRLHRARVGFRKISISYAQPSQQTDLQYLKWQIVTLLLDVPGYTLPLLTFFEIFQNRWVSPITVSDLYKVQDVCSVLGEGNRRMVALNPELQDPQTSRMPANQDVQPYCTKHYVQDSNVGKGWAEQEAPSLPNVLIPLDEFAHNVKVLLASHFNILPLASFHFCYNAEWGTLNDAENGVPLEHYITCVKQVEIAVAKNGVKYIRPCAERTPSPVSVDDKPLQTGNSSLANMMWLLEREVVDLLKTQPHCQLQFFKFVPAYHHHFGRQCRVSNYGFTKLIDLLEAIPHVVQVIGDGNKRIVTLSHRAQIRRFTAELIRALKSQPKGRMSLDEVPAVFERVLGRPFDPVDYGLCSLNDLLKQVAESVVIIGEDGDISLPVKEQTQEEIQRTEQFADEVVELLSQTPMNSLDFDNFIPAYHHHFGQQCKLADFGLAKLVDLFKAIPDTVKLDEDAKVRKISLTVEKKLHLLEEQMVDLVYPFYPPGLPLNNLESRYSWHYGNALSPLSYGARTLEELLDKLDCVQIVNETVVLLEGSLLKLIASKVRAFLINSDSGRMSLAKLRSHFSVFHETYLTPQTLVANFSEFLQMDEEDGVLFVGLNPLYGFIRKLVKVLSQAGRMSVTGLKTAYEQEYGRLPETQLYGCSNLHDFVANHPNVFVIRGRGQRQQVRLNRSFFYSLRKPNVGPFSGAAICRPPSAAGSSNSELSNSVSADERDWLSPPPVVPMPELTPLPADPDAWSQLVSPCKIMKPFSLLKPPEPSALPVPTMGQAKAEKEMSTLNTSGVMNESNSSDHSVNDLNTSGGKRKMRLAAQFALPLK
ncbi:kiaa0430 [Nesidiocoris tenuis]|uniref:Kiaa0430 n=1 Tax=Nesidiocoris tenuis TaxID=355587 RepID=A0ABN7BBM5_9HEMI|nr:kiaa0430 [Nesidiocoris tenuis]